MITSFNRLNISFIFLSIITIVCPLSAADQREKKFDAVSISPVPSEGTNISADNINSQEKFALLSTKVIDCMTQSMKDADLGKDDLNILEQTITTILFKDLCPIFELSNDTFNWDVVKIFYHNEDMKMCEPSTAPHGGAAHVHIFKQQAKNVAALKIYTPSNESNALEEIADVFRDPIFECFSTLYIKNFLDHSSPNYFKFSPLKLAGLNINPSTQQKSFFLLFEGAEGQSVTELCSVELITSNQQDIFMGYLTDISKAFAELHQLTIGKHLPLEKLRSLSESYARVSYSVDQHFQDVKLEDDVKIKEGSFGAGEALLKK